MLCQLGHSILKRKILFKESFGKSLQERGLPVPKALEVGERLAISCEDLPGLVENIPIEGLAV